MNQFKMGIHGMTCTGCEEHIEKALESIGATNIIAVSHTHLTLPTIYSV